MVKLKESPLLWLRQQLPKWSYICPSCKKTVTEKTKRCSSCECKIGVPVRVPSHLRTNQQIRDYVVKHVLPKISKFQQVMLAYHFTDLFSSGAETGDLSEFSGSALAPTVQNSDVHSGTYAITFDSNGQYVYRTLAAQTEVYCRVYVKLTAVPPTDTDYYARILHFRGNGGTDSTCRSYFEYMRGVGLRMRLARFYPAEVETSYNYAWQANVWYCFEMWFKKHASAGGYKLYLNDALVINDSGLNTSGSFDIDQVRIGADYFDEWCDIIIDDMGIMDNGPIGTLDLTRTINYETGDFSQVDGVTSSPEITELQRHCGVFSCKCNTSIYTEEGPYVDVGYQKEVYCEMDVEFENLPASGKYIEFVQVGRTGLSLFKARIYNDAGTIKWSFGHRHAGSFTWDNSAVETDPVINEWYCVKFYVKCSHVDGQAVGIYKMWVDNTELNDITETARDTDYVVVNLFRWYIYTDTPGGAVVNMDCKTIQTTVLGDCHAAGSEDIPTITTGADCVPEGTGWLQVFRNCEQIPVFDISVTEAKSGLGAVTVPFDMTVGRGDLIHVICEGEYLIAGKVTQIEKGRSSGSKKLTIQTKTQQLAGVTIDNSAHRTYEGWDAGAIAKDLVDFYFDGLFTSDFIEANTGYYLSTIDLFDKTVLSGFEELAKRGNAAYRVDHENKVHYFVRGTQSSGYTITKSDLLEPLTITASGEPIMTLKVVGTGVTGISGSGLPEATYSDRRITSSAEAQEVAEALRSRYGVITHISIKTRHFYAAHWGESIILHVPREGYKNTELIIDQITWNFKAGQCETTIQIGEDEVNLEFAMEKMVKDLQEQKINRISTHIGTDTGDANPLINFTDILDLVAGGEVEVQDGGGIMTLRTGVAGSESDAIELAYLEAEIGLGGSGGWGVVVIWFEIGDVKYGNFGVYEIPNSEAGLTPIVISMFLPLDLSGLTVAVKAVQNFGWGSDVYLTSTLKVRQYASHSHSVTQPITHEFD